MILPYDFSLIVKYSAPKLKAYLH